jgi:Xaa-Pro aminopeptidase
MVFTSEPGVYIPDQFGVRIEDVFLVKARGEPEYLSGRRAASAWDP